MPIWLLAVAAALRLRQHADQCLPFPNGCDHLLHMCAVMSFSKFNESSHCLNFATEVIHAFDSCKEESIAVEPALAVATTPPPPDSVEPVNATNGSAEEVSTIQVDPTNLTETNASTQFKFAACFTGAYPSSTPCHDVCDDILRASVERGEVCEESCNKMSSCVSSCSMEFVYPSGVSSCVGECMGPVSVDDAGTVAPKDVPPCTTSACQYWDLAAKSMDDTAWHLKFALDKANHMATATSTLRNINEMVTPPPPEDPTPFPWAKLEKRIHTYGSDPFAAFSPATPMPETLAEPMGSPVVAGISTSRKFSSRAP